jgi:hypothetical protein
MQFLNNIPSDFRLTQFFKPLYELYSVKTLPSRLSVDPHFAAVLNIVHAKAKQPLLTPDPDSCAPKFAKFDGASSVSGRKCFIAFSGGKDCLATAIRAEQEGYRPTLVYVSGVNKSLPSERRHAFAVANAIGYPIQEIKINISGNKEYNEHPLKNILILCLLIDLGAKQGATAFGLGNIFEENSTHGSLDYDLSDSFDMIRAFNRFMSRILSGYRYLTYIHDNLQSFYTVYKRDKSLIPLLSTCITPDYRKPMIQRSNQAKFGKDCVPDGRCGSCYKCADDYLFRRAFGLTRHNQAYVQKCMEAKAKFDQNYVIDVAFDRKQWNKYGGKDTEEVQVLCDRCGYYIGRLIYDRQLYRWFVYQCFGSKHYESRAYAEKVCKRFKQLYRL